VRGPLCLLGLGLLAPALAVDWKTLKPQGYVSDLRACRTPQSRAAIESYAAAVKQATGAELAFVDRAIVQGEPIEALANDLFRAWGIGRKGEMTAPSYSLRLPIINRASKWVVAWAA